MRRNHPRFGAQISRRRYDRDAAGIVMVTAVSAAAATARPVAAVVRRLVLCLTAHVLRRTATDSVVVGVVGLPAGSMLLLLLLLVQRHHVRKSLLVVMVPAGRRDTRMVMVLSVVVDPRSLGRHIRRGHARQVGQMGRWRWGMGHVLGRGRVSVHHLCGLFCFCFTHSRENFLRNSPSAIGSVCNSRSGCSATVYQKALFPLFWSLPVAIARRGIARKTQTTRDPLSTFPVGSKPAGKLRHNLSRIFFTRDVVGRPRTFHLFFFLPPGETRTRRTTGYYGWFTIPASGSRRKTDPGIVGKQ